MKIGNHLAAPAGQRSRMMAPLVACVVALVWGTVWTAAVAGPPQNSYIYGIDDANFLWQLDPVSKTSVRVYQTILTGTSNALAYDTAREDLFAVDGSNDLWWWNLVTDAPVKVATATQLGITGSEADQPWGAAYHSNSYWFFRNGNTDVETNTLVKVVLDYSGSNGVPAFQSFETFSIAGTPLTNNKFGDIAITPSGTLYAYNNAVTGRFYSLDLSTAASGTVAAPAVISTTSGTGLQLSFSADYATLYGHNYDDGKWYEINTSDGALIEVTGFVSLPDSTKGFRDLGGATIAAVPEPPAVLLAGIGAAGALWTAGRRRRRPGPPSSQEEGGFGLPVPWSRRC